MQTSAAPSAPPFRTITPVSGRSSLGLGEVWEFRDLLRTLAARDIKLRYRQTALGVVWIVFQPLLAAAIFAFVFGKVAGLKTDVDYFCFAFAGQLAWGAFAQTLGRASNSLLLNAPLVAKVFFPRLVLPLSTLFSTLLDTIVGLVVLGFVMAFKGVGTGWPLLTLPVWLLLLGAMGMGFGLMAGALAVSYRDVGIVVPVASQMLMYVSPVGWPLAELANRYGAKSAGIYLALNPVASLLEATRWSLFGRGTVPWGHVLYAASISLFVLFAGTVLFRAEERRFADVI